MGYRTVVLLNNDVCNEWEKDPALGRKIAHDMNYVHDRDSATELERYGCVIECTHADSQTLMLIDSLRGSAAAHGFYSRGETPEDVKLKLLRDMAERLGYRVVKKPTREGWRLSDCGAAICPPLATTRW